MNTAIEADVLVCGLGPAGASAAAAAAASGARVLAIDRKVEAGLPVQCAEFVPSLTTLETPAVIATRVQHIDRMLTFVGGDRPDLSPDFSGHMIDRAALDGALVARAAELGAECRFGNAVLAPASDGEVQLSYGVTVRAAVVIGADGPRSRVGEAIGCANRAFAETRQVSVDLYQPHSGTDIYLHPDIVGGYAWLFPKGGRCNIGLGVAPSFRSRLKRLLEDLHSRLAAEGRVGREVHALTGGPIPVGGISGLHGMLGRRHVLLCGDAAGLTNPVTGAGINAAVVSGRLAGEAAARIVEGDGQSALDYCEEVQDLFGRSLALAEARRRELLDTHARTGRTTEQDLRSGWIAYPEYWTRAEANRGLTGGELPAERTFA